MLTPTDVERRVVDHLERWMPTMLGAVARHAGLGHALERPRSYERASEFAKLDEVVPPSVIVVVPNMPRVAREGDGGYRATFEVVAGVLVEGGGADSWNDARDLAGWYGWALAKSMLAPSVPSDEFPDGLDPFGVTWDGAEFDALPFEASRTMAAARLPFTVEFDDVLDPEVGPIAPLEQSDTVPPDDAAVSTTDVSVTLDDPEEGD